MISIKGRNNGSLLLSKGLSYNGNIVLGLAFVHVNNRVPNPPVVITAVFIIELQLQSYKIIVSENRIEFYNFAFSINLIFETSSESCSVVIEVEASGPFDSFNFTCFSSIIFFLFWSLFKTVKTIDAVMSNVWSEKPSYSTAVAQFIFSYDSGYSEIQ